MTFSTNFKTKRVFHMQISRTITLKNVNFVGGSDKKCLQNLLSSAILFQEKNRHSFIR